MKIQNWIKENTTNLNNKTIAITGSTGELAKQIVAIFASLNANFIFINRNTLKTKKQIEDLKSVYPSIEIDFIECDLANFESVKSATKLLSTKQFDYLYLSSGVYKTKIYKTNLNFNNIFQTNFFSHYYMVKELLPKIKSNNIKVIATSSIAYNYSKIDENDIDFSTRKKHSKIYGNSKKFLTCALMELAQIEHFDLAVVHPGVTLTDMTNHYPKAINWLVKIGIKCLFPNIQKASLSLIKGLFENTGYLEWIGPNIFNIWGKPKKQKLKNISINESKKIFNISKILYENTKK